MADETCRICRSESTAEEPLYHPCKCSGSIKYVHQECLMEWLQHSQKKHCELCKTSFRFTKVYDPHMPKTLPLFVFLKLALKHFTQLLIQILRLSSVLFVWLFWLPWTVRTIWRFFFYVADGGLLFEPGITRRSPFNVSASNISISGAPGLLGLVGPDIASSIVIQESSTNSTVPQERVSEYLLPPATLTGLANLTSSAQINQILVDTFEGQIITILVVLAFILIFLIREWVVQQQPPQPLDGNGQPVQQQDPRFDELLADIERQRVRREANPPAEVQDAAPPQPMFGSGDEAEDGNNSSEESVFGGNDSEFSFRAGRTEGSDEDMPFHFEEPARVDTMGFAAGTPFTIPPYPSNEEQDVGFDLAGLAGPTYSDNEASTSAVPVPENRPMLQIRKRKGVQIEPIAIQKQPEGSTFSFRPTSPSAPFQFGSSSRSPQPDTSGSGEISWRPQTSRELRAQAAELSTQAAELSRVFEEQKRPDGWFLKQNQVSNDFQSIPETVDGEDTSAHPISEPGFENDNYEQSSPREQSASAVDPSLVPISNQYNFDLSNSSSDFNWNKYTEYSQQNVASTSGIRNAVVGTRESSSGSDASRKRASDMSWEELEEMKEQDSGSGRNEEMLQTTTFDGVNSDDDDDDDVDDDDDDDDDDVDFHDQVQREILARAIERFGDADGRLGNRIRDTDPITVGEIANLVRTGRTSPDQTHGDSNQPQEQGAESEPEIRVEDPDNNMEVAPIAPAPVVVNAIPQPPMIPLAVPGANEPAANPGDDDVEVDVDDFDGVMELIGMRGPLMALVQNGIFSALLISATIGIGVWMPYMWGRMVLLILSNPLGFFITLPYKATIFIIELFIDLAIMFGSFLVYLSDISGRWLVAPAGFVFPYLKKVASSRTTADLTQKLASEAHGRISKSITALVSYVVSLRSFQTKQTPGPLFKWPTGQSWDKAVDTISKTANIIGLNGTDFSLKIKQFIEYQKTISDNTTELLPNSTSLTVPSFNETHTDNITGNGTFIQDLASVQLEVPSWTPLDRVITVIAGYVFISVVGAFYLQHKKNLAKKGIHPQGIDRKIVEGLSQAGSVMKVVLIIGIEMFVFPLYCGFLLDLALLPLFEHATVWNRWLFLKEFMFTSLFVHWFIGTCYMFHFALFVSMCRNIMRDGVLYFIRDPDDPTFHPVKEVLERPVTTQLKKIGFSAIIYGVLVIMFLGGVVWALYYTFSGLLPVHWSSNEPVLEFPVDLLFYNIFMPVAIKYFRPANILEKIYGWWFRQCAKVLRLSSFMFGERQPEEEGVYIRQTWAAWLLRRKAVITPQESTEEAEKNPRPDPREPESGVIFERNGRFVRAPAKDSVRPSRENLFIEVNEKNVRVDGKEDPADGDFGPNSENVMLVYLPPNFKARIGAVICLIWLFAACTGVTVTVGPLVLGRFILGMMLPGSLRMNDLYAFSLGLYAIGAVVLVISSFNAAKEAAKRMKPAVATVQAFKDTALVCSIRAFKIFYILTAFVVVLPTLFAFVMEAYIILPLHTYFSTNDNHVIHFIQDWTLGVLYVKMLGRMILLDRESAWSQSLRAIVANGYLNPNVRIATQKFILPAGGSMVAALFVPLTIGFAINKFIGASPELSHQIYRYSYPAVLVVSATTIGLFFIYRLFDSWKQSLRDEIYLVGEQLHNHSERRRPEVVPITTLAPIPEVAEAEPLLDQQGRPGGEFPEDNHGGVVQVPPHPNDDEIDNPALVLERMDSSVQTAGA
ncbi:hypothetical protein DRE_04522 [Drechslerella stenobrocha 248]|uniref:RING-type E3 ubiquitin transferase n=1 Tax=Drechslerella stenobrocha 248 TaxID=1043628 RepID=W7HQB2_9PEZI|nr:hypothetical protein DRE_04522 [Drechslerella stenobrocha 248]